MKSRKVVSWDKGKIFRKENVKEKRMKKTVSFMLVFAVSVSLVSTFLVGSVSGAENITLRFWATASSTRDRGRRIIWQNFEKENPGVKVDFEGIPWDKFTEKVLTSSVTGTLPDGVRYGFVARFASKGLVMPLDEFIEGPNGIDPSQYLEGVFPNPSITWNGEIYALPHAWGMYPAVAYNRDILKEVGVDPPTTWKEIRAVAKKLTKKASDGEVIRYGMQMSGYNMVINGFVGTNGGTFTDVVGQGATKATYSAPENVEGFQFLADMVKDGYLLVLRGELEAKNFIEGKAAMWFLGSSDASRIRPEIYPELNWGITRCPVPEGKPIVVPAGYHDAAYMFKSTKYPELAWKLLKAYSWKEGNSLVWIHKFGSMPPFKDVLDENTLNGYYYPFQVESHLRKIMEIAINYPSIARGPDRWHLQGSEIQNLELGQYDLILAGEKSVKEGLEYLDRKVGALL